MERWLIEALTLLSLAVLVGSLLLLKLHLGPLEDRIRTPCCWVDGTTLFFGVESMRAARFAMDLGWLAVMASVLPGARLFSWSLRRAGRVSLGRCLNCGYDLRSTPQRCPECGTVVLAAEPLPLAPPIRPTAAAEKTAIIQRLARRGPGR